MTRQPPTDDQVYAVLEKLQQPYVEPMEVLGQILQDLAQSRDTSTEVVIATVTSQIAVDGYAPALRHGAELTQIIHTDDLHLYVSDDGDLIRLQYENGRAIYSLVDMDPATYPPRYSVDQLNLIIDAAANLLSEQTQH